ncbi:MAG: 16S rRNA (cytidine(1402)-2'-O)-methyltransferase [Tenericutes bacterium HGW-Tenericutes-8]|nr:MAG: 16S rRNA (cytidine(1402)-2'-O)-methyltransferase [Tenericutes bacterium HGW-Tenericutes-8]
MIRRSFDGDKPTLYLISTPIGNLKDITLRALETLNAVQVIFAEDTRNTLKLLSHYEIKKPIKSYHEHNKKEATEQVLYHLGLGESVGLVTDAGTPAISDPGFDLVLAVKDTYPVVSIPGASAVLAALVSSGLVPQPFTFFGFLDRNESKKKDALNKLSGLSHTMIFYERGDRIKDTLTTINAVLGNRKVVLAKELTKQFETFFEGTVEDIINLDFNEKGEFVLMVEGRIETLKQNGNMYEDVLEYIMLGYNEKDAIKKVAKDYKVHKNDVYQAVVNKGGIKHD